MDTDVPASPDMEILTALGAKLINAILEHEPLENIKGLIDSGAPLWYQDEAEGMSPLHAAAYCDGECDELIKLLINEGAVWNAGWLMWFCSFMGHDQRNFSTVDHLHNTAGDIALSLNNEPCYTAIRDAGIRAGKVLFYFIYDLSHHLS